LATQITSVCSSIFVQGFKCQIENYNYRRLEIYAPTKIVCALQMCTKITAKR